MRVCSVDGCDKDHSSKGLCGMHYQRVRRESLPREMRPCSIIGCKNSFLSRGLCSTHYKQAFNAGWSGEWSKYKVRERSICTIVGCKAHVVGQGLCSMHRKRMQRHGVTDKPIRGSGDYCANGCGKPKQCKSYCRKCYNERSMKWYANNREKGRAASTKWHKNNKEHSKRIQVAHRLMVKNDPVRLAEKRAKQRVASEKLMDSYIKVVLGVKNPPQELIELKRVQLKIHREINRGSEI
jgi:hypothetical protein